MSVPQYGRKVSILVGTPGGAALEFSSFKVSFAIKHGDIQAPNTLDVRIYNLADATANRIQREFTDIAVSAGYAGNYGVIFQGSIKQIRKGRVDQLDSYVDITAADGDESYNFASISQSLAAGTDATGVAAALLSAMQAHGVTKGYQPNFPKNGCVRGRVLYGMARDELRDFAWTNDCAWSIQGGKLTFIPFTSYIPGQVPLITPQTGLIGIPEQTEGGIRFRCLLNPTIKLGQLVKLDSTIINRYRYGLDVQSQASRQLISTSIKTSADGLYYCMVVEHSGDTRSNEFYTDVVCLAADATLKDTNALDALFAADANTIQRYD